MSDPIVIGGGGLAGATAAATLREEGFDGRVSLIGDEPERPYERPPLPKGFLAGESGREDAYVHEHGFSLDHDIDLRTGVPVVRLEPQRRLVTLADGSELRFRQLLRATGAAPRRLDVPGEHLGNVLHLRTLADADDLRGHLGTTRDCWSSAEASSVARSPRRRGSVASR